MPRCRHYGHIDALAVDIATPLRAPMRYAIIYSAQRFATPCCSLSYSLMLPCRLRHCHFDYAAVFMPLRHQRLFTIFDALTPAAIDCLIRHAYYFHCCRRSATLMLLLILFTRHSTMPCCACHAVTLCAYCCLILLRAADVDTCFDYADYALYAFACYVYC